MEVATGSDDMYPGDTKINEVRLVKIGARYRLAVDFWNNLRIQTVYITKNEARELLDNNRQLWFKLLFECRDPKGRVWMESCLTSDN